MTKEERNAANAHALAAIHSEYVTLWCATVSVMGFFGLIAMVVARVVA